MQSHPLTHVASRTSIVCLIACVVDHLLSEEESRPSFLTQPVNEYRATHPLNLFSPLAIFFSLPHFTRGGPLFISPSLLCSIICSLFFLLFFLSLGDFVYSLIFSQFLLSSSILSVPLSSPPRFGTISPRAPDRWPLLRARPPPPPFHLSRPSVRQSVLLFSFLSQDHVCRCCFRCCLLQMILAGTLPF